jgi:hypothetical protein
MFVDKSRLKRVPNRILKICTVISTLRQLLAIFKNDSVFAMKPRLELFYLVDLNYR